MESFKILFLRLSILLLSPLAVVGASSSSSSSPGFVLGRTTQSRFRQARHHRSVTATGSRSYRYRSKAAGSDAAAVVVEATASGGSSDGSNHQNDSFDMDELKKRIAFETNPYGTLFDDQRKNTASSDNVSNKNPAEATAATSKAPITDRDRVHIVLFQGKGVHSIEYPPGSGSNLILAFESKLACDKFAALLKKQQFFDPTPQEIDLMSLETFCARLGVYVQVVPKGVDLVPPTKRVQKLGQKNPSLRQQRTNLEYVFAMIDGPEFEDDGVLMATVTTAVTAAAAASGVGAVVGSSDAPPLVSCWE